MKFSGLFRRDPNAAAAHALYAAAVTQARRDSFYLRGGVPDTIDGRFDMVALHAYLILRRLGREGKQASALSQAIFDIMFADMDQNLREIGVGDLSVGKKVKAMAKAFYGRIAAYDAGLEGGDRELGEALRRNVYRKSTVDDEQVAVMVTYVRRQAAALDSQPLESFMAGEVTFAESGGQG